MAASRITLKFGKFECDPCRFIKKKRREASVFCKDCKECLCIHCQKYHQLVTLTRNHRLVTMEVSRTLSEPEVPQNSLKCSALKHKNGADTSTISQDTAFSSAFDTEGMLTKSHTGIESLASVSTSSTINTQHVFSYTKATLSEQFNSSVVDDELPCEIRGIVFIGENLAVADMNNNKVKIFDQNYSFHCQCLVQSPFDMAALNTVEPQEIAVTSKNRIITILSLKDSKLSMIRTISTSMPCYGICYHSDLIYVVCRHHCKDQLPQIQVYTSAGACRRRIEPISQGSMVLYRPDYITFNPQNGYMYITEWNKGVVVLTNLGTYISCYLPPNLHNSQGIVVADGGDVYVCGLNSDNVLQLSSDKLTSVELVFEDKLGFKAPQSLCVKGDKLILCCRTTDVVRVFRLS